MIPKQANSRISQSLWGLVQGFKVSASWASQVPYLLPSSALLVHGHVCTHTHTHPSSNSGKKKDRLIKNLWYFYLIKFCINERKTQGV